MHWSDQGLVLGARKHGETSIILELMTRAHGRHLGLVHGGRSKALRAVLAVPTEAVMMLAIASHWRGVRRSPRIASAASELRAGSRLSRTLNVRWGRRLRATISRE